MLTLTVVCVEYLVNECVWCDADSSRSGRSIAKWNIETTNKQSIQKKTIDGHPASWHLIHVSPRTAHRLLNGDAVIYYYFIGNCNGASWAHATKTSTRTRRRGITSLQNHLSWALRLTYWTCVPLVRNANISIHTFVMSDDSLSLYF